MTRSRSRRLLLLVAAAGALAVVGLGGVCWRDIASRVRFYWLFESVGKNEQGYPEYRHRQTGIVMVRVPGGTITKLANVSGGDPAVPTSPILVPGSPPLLPPPLSELEVVHHTHDASLSPFLIAKYKVTGEEWGRGFAGGELADDPFRQGYREFCTRTALKLPTPYQWNVARRAIPTVHYGGGPRIVSASGRNGESSGFHPAFFPLPPGL